MIMNDFNYVLHFPDGSTMNLDTSYRGAIISSAIILSEKIGLDE